MPTERERALGKQRKHEREKALFTSKLRFSEEGRIRLTQRSAILKALLADAATKAKAAAETVGEIDGDPERVEVTGDNVESVIETGHV